MSEYTSLLSDFELQSTSVTLYYSFARIFVLPCVTQLYAIRRLGGLLNRHERPYLYRVCVLDVVVILG